MKIDYFQQLAKVFSDGPYVERTVKQIERDHADQLNTYSRVDGHVYVGSEADFIIALLRAGSGKSYLLTQTALDVIEKISVTPKFDLTLLNKKDKVNIYTFFISKTLAYKVMWGNDALVAVKVEDAGGSTPQQANLLQTQIFLDLRKPSVIAGTAEVSAVPEPRPLLDFFSDYMGTEHQARTVGLAQEVIRILLFLELTDPTFLLIPAGKKFATRPMGYSSTAPTGITIVTSKWNFHLVRTEGFGVSGHYRAQRVGVGLSRVEMVWVNPYQKKGMTIKAKSKPSEREEPGVAEGAQEPPVLAE